MKIRIFSTGSVVGACIIGLCGMAGAQEAATTDPDRPTPRTSETPEKQAVAEPGFDARANGYYDRYERHLENKLPSLSEGDTETRRREWKTWSDARKGWTEADRDWRKSDHEWRTPEYQERADAEEYWKHSDSYWDDSNRFWEGYRESASVRERSPGVSTDPADRTKRTPFSSPNDALYDRYVYHRQHGMTTRADDEPEKIADEDADRDEKEWEDWDDARADWREFDEEWREEDRVWRSAERREDEGYEQYRERSDEYWSDSDRFWDTEVRRGPEDKEKDQHP